MIIYEVVNLKLGTHHYVAELINQAEINLFNKIGIEVLLAGTNVPVNMIKTILVDKLDEQNITKENIYKRAMPYVIEKPNEVISQIVSTPGTFRPIIIPKVKVIETPSVDTKTTEVSQNDIENQYREFILLLQKSETEIASIRKKISNAFAKLQATKNLAKISSNTNNGIDK